MITFAVIGHNEAPTLDIALDQATAAARPGDSVWFVDSASTDNSREIATARGIHVVSASLGKGNAISQLLQQCRTEFVCCLDGDIFDSAHNIAAVLAASVRDQGDDLILGDFTDRPNSILSNTVAVYEPLVRALFPEVPGRCGSKPLTGFRAFRVSGAGAALPPDFGIEAHLNLVFGLAPTGRIRVVDVGHYEGRFRYKPAMGTEIARAILDVAQRTGRIDAATRSAWEQWLKPVIAHIATFQGDWEHREAYVAQLLELAERPSPGS